MLFMMIDWANPIVRLICGMAAIAFLTALGFYAAAKLREYLLQHTLSASEMLQKFREMEREGVLEEEEFRIIRRQLSEEVVRETRREHLAFGFSDRSVSQDVLPPVIPFTGGDETRAHTSDSVETRFPEHNSPHQT